MLLRADDMILSLLRGLMASSNFLLTSLMGGESVTSAVVGSSVGHFVCVVGDVGSCLLGFCYVLVWLTEA